MGYICGMISIILQPPYAMLLGWERILYTDSKAFCIHLVFISIEFALME